jgi:hypothetical protein
MDCRAEPVALFQIELMIAKKDEGFQFTTGASRPDESRKIES